MLAARDAGEGGPILFYLRLGVVVGSLVSVSLLVLVPWQRLSGRVASGANNSHGRRSCRISLASLVSYIRRCLSHPSSEAVSQSQKAKADGRQQVVTSA